MKNKIYKLIEGTNFVVTTCDRKDDEYPFSNFKNTGMSLCGVLKNGETLEDFIKRKSSKKTIEEIAKERFSDCQDKEMIEMFRNIFIEGYKFCENEHLKTIKK